MSSRYLRIAAVIAFIFASSAASACPGANTKTDDSQAKTTSSSTRGG